MTADKGQGREALGVGVLAPVIETGHGTTHWLVERWDEDQTNWVKQQTGLLAPEARQFQALKVRPYNVTEHHGNLVLTAGWTRALNLLTNQGATQAYDATHTRIGVGDGTTAVTAADTTLTGSTNKQFVLVSGAGTVSTNTLAFSASFTGSLANFHWQKFGIDQGTSNGITETAPLFNAAVSDQGTKTSGQTWTATATLTFT